MYVPTFVEYMVFNNLFYLETSLMIFNIVAFSIFHKMCFDVNFLMVVWKYLRLSHFKILEKMNHVTISTHDTKFASHHLVVSFALLQIE